MTARFYPGLAALFCALLSSVTGSSNLVASVPGTSLVDTIDLSPGPDCYSPYQVVVNHNTHKLYAPGAGSNPKLPPGSNHAVKVIDTTTNSAIAGVDLGYYVQGGSSKAFLPLAATIDEGPAPLGNKLYILGAAGGSETFVRVINGATDSNETSEGTDVLLPEGGTVGGNYSLAVNPSNHKVYVITPAHHVVVIDGPQHEVLATLSTSLGLTGAVVVVNPDTNKVFVLTFGQSVIIDSDDDSFTTLSLPFYPKAAAIDPGTGRLFVVGTDTAFGQDAVLYVLDGSSGATITSNPDIPPLTQGIAIDSTAGLVYLTQPFPPSSYPPGEIASFATEDLSPKENYMIGGTSLAIDGGDSTARLYLVANIIDPAQELANQVAVIHPTNGRTERITVGYSAAQVAVNPRTNRIYVADEGARELTVVDGGSHDIVAHIPTEVGVVNPPGGMASKLDVSVAQNRIYLSRTVKDLVTNDVTSFVDIYDGETNSALPSITVASGSSSVFPYASVDDTRSHLYVSGQSDTSGFFVNVYNLDDNSLIKTLVNVTYTRESLVSPVSGLLYLAGGNYSPVAIVDPSTDFNLSSVPAGDIPGQMAVNVKSNRIFVIDRLGHDITVINGDTSSLETAIKNPEPEAFYTSVAVDDVTNTVYASGYSSGTLGVVAAFDGNNGYAFLGQLDVGPSPHDVAFNSGTRQLVVYDSREGMLDFLESSTPAPPDRLSNISTRLGVQSGDNVLIGGFIVSGEAGSTKQVLIRGIGPSLAAFGVSGPLADPTLELHSGNATLAVNDSWKIGPDGQSQEAAIVATNLPPSDDQEAAILMNLAPGSYTAVLRGADGGTGIGLVEVYDLAASDTSKMVNISTRGRVETGDNVMIGGVIVTGASPSQVILRAIGPSLTDFGVADSLQDPVLELHDNQGALIATNDNWQDDNLSEIARTGLAPKDNHESAIIATLYPANYTAIVRGKDNTTGVGLVEAYYFQ